MERGPCYMWTFTFRECLDVSVARTLWSRLSATLVREMEFVGLRVFELHPGGHGLHIHVVALGRYNVNTVRQLSRCQGFGRIHVGKRLPNIEAAMYCAKYLFKQERPECFKGSRLWASVGKLDGWEHCRVRSVKLDSMTSRAVKYARKFMRVRGVPLMFAAALVLHEAVAVGDDLRGNSPRLQVAMCQEWAAVRYERQSRFNGAHEPNPRSDGSRGAGGAKRKTNLV